MCMYWNVYVIYLFAFLSCASLQIISNGVRYFVCVLNVAIFGHVHARNKTELCHVSSSVLVVLVLCSCEFISSLCRAFYLSQ